MLGALGIDIDGTLTRYPEFFVQLGCAWRAAGGAVYLITGLGTAGVAQRWAQWPVLADTRFYTRIVTTAEYNAEERALIGREPDNEKIVGRFKQRMCQELGVVVMFDDQALIHRQLGPIPVFQVA